MNFSFLYHETRKLGLQRIMAKGSVSCLDGLGNSLLTLKRIPLCEETLHLVIKLNHPTKSLIFRKLLLFLQNKARTADSLQLQVYLCMTTVYIVSFYAKITKIRARSYRCRFTKSKPYKESHVAV